MNRIIAVVILSFALTGCQSMQNTMMEKVFGVEKRELLKKAVQSVNKDQKKAQVEFKDAMTQLKELYGFQGGNLEVTYNKFKSSYDQSKAQADTVKKRIDNMQGIAKSMFAEWNNEIKQYTNDAFAADSRNQLAETKARYEELYRSVRDAEESMNPVLKQLNDHVLYLKHNLNAAAIGSLKGEATDIQMQIDKLIQRMNDSIAQADRFIQTLLRP